MANHEAHAMTAPKEEGELSEDDDDACNHRQLQFFNSGYTTKTTDRHFSVKDVQGNKAVGYNLMRVKSPSVRHESKHSRRNEVNRSKRWNEEDVRVSSSSSNSSSLENDGRRYKETHRCHTHSPQRHGSSKCILLYHVFLGCQ